MRGERRHRRRVRLKGSEQVAGRCGHGAGIWPGSRRPAVVDVTDPGGAIDEEQRRLELAAPAPPVAAGRVDDDDAVAGHDVVGQELADGGWVLASVDEDEPQSRAGRPGDGVKVAQRASAGSAVGGEEHDHGRVRIRPGRERAALQRRPIERRGPRPDGQRRSQVGGRSVGRGPNITNANATTAAMPLIDRRVYGTDDGRNKRDLADVAVNGARRRSGRSGGSKCPKGQCEQPPKPAGGAGAGVNSGGAWKSSMSRSASLFASLAVSAGSPNRVSMKRVIAVCSWTTCETKCGLAYGEISTRGTRTPSSKNAPSSRLAGRATQASSVAVRRPQTRLPRRSSR